MGLSLARVRRQCGFLERRANDCRCSGDSRHDTATERLFLSPSARVTELASIGIAGFFVLQACELAKVAFVQSLQKVGGHKDFPFVFQ